MQPDFHKPSALFYFCALDLAASFVFGGGTLNSYLGNIFLQLLSLPVLFTALCRLLEASPPLSLQAAIFILCASLAVPIVQLAPLPHVAWTGLPMREEVVNALTSVGGGSDWAPLSLAPEATWQAALAMLPPVSIFFGVAMLDNRERWNLTIVTLIFGVLNATVGLLQFAQSGGAASLNFYGGQAGEAVGFFANRDHFSALLYSLSVFAAMWLARVGANLYTNHRQRGINTDALIRLVVIFPLLAMLIATVILARSRAGAILAMLALLASWILQPRAAAGARGANGRGIYVGFTSLAAVFGLQYGIYRLLERFDADSLTDARIPIAIATARLVVSTMPFGVGLGAFPRFYAAQEEPRQLISNAYVNHAHNDFLELFLETGAFGVMLVIAWGWWCLVRCVDVWQLSGGEQGPEDWRLLGRASSVIIGLLGIHSVVDYPLRAGGLLMLLGFCFALLTPGRVEKSN